METVFLIAAGILGGVFLYIRRRRALASNPLSPLAERAFCFFSRFCALRREHDILGSAKLSFRESRGCSVFLQAEMTMIFSGSTVILREDVGRCEKEEVPLLGEALRLRLQDAFPGTEVDVGARGIFIR